MTRNDLGYYSMIFGVMLLLLLGVAALARLIAYSVARGWNAGTDARSTDHHHIWADGYRDGWLDAHDQAATDQLALINERTQV